MRRLTENQAKLESEAQTEPSAKKSRSDNRITNIATLDNDTIVEAFRYLKYCGLAKTSLVSKRFCDLIRTHRHKLALLDVKSISMDEVMAEPTDIKIFDKPFTPEEYNNWVIRNGYSKQIPPETQIAGMQSTEYERKTRLNWIKGHVRCYECDIMGPDKPINLPSNFDEEFLDFFMTGANYTSSINLRNYEPCKLITRFVQKFMDLKDGDEDKVVGSIECNPCTTVNIDAFKRDYADFVVEGNINETSGLSNLVFEFVNNDIGKKLRLSIRINFDYHTPEFTLKVANL
ncbi:hypothetical protein Ddc_17557 [Ditylenchus destructor]|nr:hypothetical protein Ddc_17557 [Ditylenchus destructor]